MYVCMYICIMQRQIAYNLFPSNYVQWWDVNDYDLVTSHLVCYVKNLFIYLFIFLFFIYFFFFLCLFQVHFNFSWGKKSFTHNEKTSQVGSHQNIIIHVII